MASDSIAVTSFEDLLELAGTKGRRNILIFLGCCIGCMITSMHTFAYQFLGITPVHWCHIEEIKNSNWSVEEIKDIAIPYNIINNKRQYESCLMKNLNYSYLSLLTYQEARSELDANSPDLIFDNQTLFCSSRDFEEHVETIVNKWDLVCDRRALYSTTEAAIQGGMLLGAFSFGYLISKFGRFFIYKLCVICYIIGAYATAISPTVSIFILLKVITAMLGQGIYMAGFVLSMEFCSAKQRSLVSNFYVLPWAIGIMLTPVFGFLVPTWYWLEVVITSPALILIINFWILVESPRWLILKKRYEEAADILIMLAESNSNSLPPKAELLKLTESLNIEEERKEEGKTTKLKSISQFISELFILVTTKKYRIQTLSIYFCWFSVSMVYYGVTLGSVALSTNLYLYMFLGGVIEIPSYVLLWPAVVILGRKKTLILLFFTCSISILLGMAIILTFQDNNYSTLKLILFLAGKFAITAAFHLLWVYTAELYPTNYRSLIVGEANAVGRVGSICSPYINDLLGVVTIWAPAALFGGFSIAAGLLTFIFPETTGRNLPEDSKSEITKPKRTAKNGVQENPSFVDDETL